MGKDATKGGAVPQAKTPGQGGTPQRAVGFPSRRLRHGKAGTAPRPAPFLAIPSAPCSVDLTATGQNGKFRALSPDWRSFALSQMAQHLGGGGLG